MRWARVGTAAKRTNSRSGARRRQRVCPAQPREQHRPPAGEERAPAAPRTRRGRRPPPSARSGEAEPGRLVHQALDAVLRVRRLRLGARGAGAPPPPARAPQRGAGSAGCERRRRATRVAQARSASAASAAGGCAWPARAPTGRRARRRYARRAVLADDADAKAQACTARQLRDRVQTLKTSPDSSASCWLQRWSG